MLGGTLDFYFFSGPTPSQVIEQYSEVIGKPAWQNAWAFGYQQCRWGYEGISELREVIRRMNDSNIPLEGQSRRTSPTILAVSIYVFEVIWNDIDLYHAYRDFTTDPVRYPAEVVKNFISELASVPAPSDGFLLICIPFIVDRKRATLRADCGCGDSRVNQQD
jgi:alpha-glucosidase